MLSSIWPFQGPWEDFRNVNSQQEMTVRTKVTNHRQDIRGVSVNLHRLERIERGSDGGKHQRSNLIRKEKPIKDLFGALVLIEAENPKARICRVAQNALVIREAGRVRKCTCSVGRRSLHCFKGAVTPAQSPSEFRA